MQTSNDIYQGIKFININNIKDTSKEFAMDFGSKFEYFIYY